MFFDCQCYLWATFMLVRKIVKRKRILLHTSLSNCNCLIDLWLSKRLFVVSCAIKFYELRKYLRGLCVKFLMELRIKLKLSFINSLCAVKTSYTSKTSNSTHHLTYKLFPFAIFTLEGIFTFNSVENFSSFQLLLSPFLPTKLFNTRVT